MNEIPSLESLQGIEERKIKREFEMLSGRIARYDRLKREAVDLWTERFFQVKKDHSLSDLEFLKMVELPENLKTNEIF